MKQLATASAAILSFGITINPALAQNEAPDAGQAGFVEWTENELFASQVVGIAVMAPEDGTEALWIDEIRAEQQFMIDSSELEGVRYVGRITDMLLTRTGELVAVVISQIADPDDPTTGLPPDADAVAEPLPGTVPEVAIDPERLMFLSDSIVPNLNFAIIGMSMEEFYEGPLIDRGAILGIATGPDAVPTAPPGLHTGWRTGWHAGRDMMMPPDVAVPGFAPIPVMELSVDELTGAAIYGMNNEFIGNVDDVLLGPEGEVSYLTSNIGGFLGIGSREVAIGFDEVTILSDVDRIEVQVHVAATREMLEEMPEYER